MRTCRMLIAAAGLTLLAASGAAHEPGNAQVSATFRHDGTYEIVVVVDPESLLARLESLSGRPQPGAVAPFERDRRLHEAADAFLDCITILFDATEAHPLVEYVPPRLADGLAPAAPAKMRLRGRTPDGARSFRWAYSLVVGSYPLVVQSAAGPPVTRWIVGAQETTVELTPRSAASRGQVALQYLALGFTHILPKGLDHILFVLGIFLLSARLKPVLLQVTSFTLAHTLTLGMTIYGVVSLPASVVEPLIALSIVYIAFENLLTHEVRPWRVALVFAFGLLHGMGFAGVLKELGLPHSEFLTALVTFNLGVEAGQLAVIASAFVAVAMWCRHERWYRSRIVVPASAAVACIGLYWTLVRLTPPR